MENKYVKFNYIAEQVLDVCKKTGKKVPINRTLRRWLNNENDNQLVSVRRYDDKYSYNDAVKMLLMDHDINLGLSGDTENPEIVDIQDTPMHDYVVASGNYENDPELKNKVDSRIKDLKMNIIFNMLLEKNGYKGFNDDAIFYDVTIDEMNKIKSKDELNQNDYIRKTNLANANTRRYLVKKNKR